MSTGRKKVKRFLDGDGDDDDDDEDSLPMYSAECHGQVCLNVHFICIMVYWIS